MDIQMPSFLEIETELHEKDETFSAYKVSLKKH
jgi:hypothetical protein